MSGGVARSQVSWLANDVTGERTLRRRRKWSVLVRNLSGSVLRGDVTCHNTGEGDVRGDLSGGGILRKLVEFCGRGIRGFRKKFSMLSNQVASNRILIAIPEMIFAHGQFQCSLG
ncbi:hypothetical protein CEXT_10131 [Caerostris extrusa]|uniref:Uncharacterized protein n=1 Tax=Caerostris extrusa TaxID=172846 RepID=A0AAV4Y7S8_CAEEX|nr:hypothetical protein CEXT_10131 [Caerostris extrusa]